tara:strand:+ start:1824 stop:2156 length:333 start_codon:yes stop_codon:yes gene_type:complete
MEGRQTSTDFDGVEFENEDGKIWMLTGQLVWNIYKDDAHNIMPELDKDSHISLAVHYDDDDKETRVGIEGNTVHDYVDVSNWINEKQAMDKLENDLEHYAIEDARDGKFL